MPQVRPSDISTQGSATCTSRECLVGPRIHPVVTSGPSGRSFRRYAMQVGPAHSVAKSGCAHSAGVTSYAESPQGTPPSDEGLGSEICGIAGRIEHKEENMATDLRVTLEDRPGTLADRGEARGKAGVNIDAMCGVTCGGEGVSHLLAANGMLATPAPEEGRTIASEGPE